jgi:ubiquinone/menaquinone biosynthesis C-methylase UbiE
MAKNNEKSEGKKIVEAIGKYTDKQHEVANAGWLFYDAPYKAARHIAKRVAGDRVLDLGGGTGIMASIIGAVTGREMHIEEKNIYETGYVDDEFDTVYSSHVLEHVEDPVRVIKESIRIAKSRIIHIVPEGYTEDINIGTEHKHQFDRNNFMGLIGTAIKDMKNVGIADIDFIADAHINSLICVLLKEVE